MPDLLKKKIFWRCFRNQKTGKIFTLHPSPSIRVRHRNRSGVVELVGTEPLMFARVENGVTKSCPFSPEKQEKRHFGLKFSATFFLFWAGSLVVRRSRESTTRHRRDRISDKNSRKRRRKNGSEFFFSKVGVRIRVFNLGNFHFLAAEKLKLTFGGGYNFKTS